MSSSMMMNEEEKERSIIRYLKNFASGWRIDPTPEELIAMHRESQLKDAPVPVNPTKDVYFYSHNPWELTENCISHRGNEFYFFAMRDAKSAIWSVKNRVAGIGYWKAYDQEIPIYERNGVEIGSKRLLDFYKGKAPNGDKTSWVMHEYNANVRAATKAKGDMQLIEWVLWKIYKRVEEDPAAAENRLNIIENTVTRVENTATREGSTSRDIYIGTSGISYDPDTLLLWKSNKCLGNVLKNAEEKPEATPPQ